MSFSITKHLKNLKYLDIMYIGGNGTILWKDWLKGKQYLKETPRDLYTKLEKDLEESISEWEKICFAFEKNNKEYVLSFDKGISEIESEMKDKNWISIPFENYKNMKKIIENFGNFNELPKSKIEKEI